MKHIKKFEKASSGVDYWLVTYTEDLDNTNYLFPDKNSAENWIVHLINKDRRQLMGHNYKDKMIFTDIDSAMFWYERNVDIKINLQRIFLEQPYDGDKDMIKMRDSLNGSVKRYNL